MNKDEKINELLKFFKTVTVFTDDGIEQYEKDDDNEEEKDQK